MSQGPRTHTLAVVVDEPKEGAWHAWCPVLLDQGAATWAATREEALEHIREVVRMTAEHMAAAGVPIPASGAAVHPAGSVPALGEQVAVTIRIPVA